MSLAAAAQTAPAAALVHAGPQGGRNRIPGGGDLDQRVPARIRDLQRKFAPQRDQLKSLSDEVDSLTKQLQAQGATLSDADRATKARQIDEKKKQAQRIAEDAQNDYRRRCRTPSARSRRRSTRCCRTRPEAGLRHGHRRHRATAAGSAGALQRRLRVTSPRPSSMPTTPSRVCPRRLRKRLRLPSLRRPSNPNTKKIVKRGRSHAALLLYAGIHTPEQPDGCRRGFRSSGKTPTCRLFNKGTALAGPINA